MTNAQAGVLTSTAATSPMPRKGATRAVGAAEMQQALMRAGGVTGVLVLCVFQRVGELLAT